MSATTSQPGVPGGEPTVDSPPRLSPSKGDVEKRIAYSDIVHLAADTALFALRLRADAASTVRRPSTDDPMTRGKRNREAQRRKREESATRRAEKAAKLATLSMQEQSPTQEKIPPSFAGRCTSKSCAPRNVMEETLVSRWETIKSEHGRKVKEVHELQRSVIEKEKQRDNASVDLLAQKAAIEAAKAGVEDRQRLSKETNERIRQVTDELSCLDVELRKRRIQHKEMIQHCMPLPRGFMSESPHAWMTSEGEPFVPDGLTVVFDNNRKRCGWERGKRYGAAGWVGSGKDSKSGAHDRAPAWQSSSCLNRQARCEGYWGQSSVAAGSVIAREHPGKFRRWGTEVQEQWSCCLREKEEKMNESSGKMYRGMAGGCDVVPARSTPNGMTTADDVHLVWRRPSERAYIRGASDPFEAWGGGNNTDDRRQWAPKTTLGVGINKRCAGAAWSLIRRRPHTAHGMTTMAAFFSGSGRAGRENVPNVGNGIGDNSISSFGVASRSFGSQQPGSAPPKCLDNHPTVRRVSSLKMFREARTKAGWKPLHSTHFSSVDKSARRDFNVKGSIKRSAWHSQAQGSLSRVGTVSVHSR